MPTILTEPPSVDVWVLRCRNCDSVVEVSAADATDYACTEWPRCCGEVMALSAETDQVSGHSTRRRETA
jgi:hypothetical protein